MKRIYLDVCVYTRFLALRTSAVPRLDSVERHQLWQAQLDKDNFFDEVFKATPGPKVERSSA